MKSKYSNNFHKIFVNYKIWLSSVTGDGAIGDTEYRLLKHIVGSESLKAASNELGISYRKAWGDLKKAENTLGYQLLEKQRGGKNGGTSIVTLKAKKLIEAYEALQQTFDEKIEKAFKEFKKKIK